MEAVIETERSVSEVTLPDKSSSKPTVQNSWVCEMQVLTLARAGSKLVVLPASAS